jgi:GAF domain-containing protein
VPVRDVFLTKRRGSGSVPQVMRVGKQELYRELLTQVERLFEGEHDFIANAAGLAAVLYQGLPQVNWAGFYLLKEQMLVLGPFQGKPACVRIALGRGVCGAAAAERRTIVVGDVHAFPGHIACDAASNAEIVVPLIAAGRLIGVLDLDSPTRDRFDAADAAGLEAIVQTFLAHSDAPALPPPSGA